MLVPRSPPVFPPDHVANLGDAAAQDTIDARAEEQRAETTAGILSAELDAASAPMRPVARVGAFGGSFAERASRQPPLGRLHAALLGRSWAYRHPVWQG